MTSAKNLSILAAESITLEIWKHVVSHLSNEKASALCNIPLFMENKETLVAKEIENCGLPVAAKQIMIRFIPPISDTIMRWIRLHQNWGLFGERSSIKMNEYLRQLVWNTDNSINYRETAKSLLRWEKMKSEMKFRWACTYCLTDYILEYGKATPNEDMDDDNDPLIQYWSDWVTKRLYGTKKDEGSVENLVLQKIINTGNWTAMEYFFGVVNSEERLSNAIHIIEKLGQKFQKKVLSLLRTDERSQVVHKTANDLIANYVRLDNFLDARSIWSQVKGTLDVLEVRRIAHELFLISEAPNGISIELYHKKLANFFAEIWSILDVTNKRNFIMEDLYQNTFNVMHFIHDVDAKYNDKILEIVMKDQEEHVNRGFFKDNWEWLLIGQKTSSVRQLLENFTTKEDMISFKALLRNTPNSKKHCINLLQCGYIRELENFIKFRLDDPGQLSDGITTLIKSSEANTACQFNLVQHRWRGFGFFLNHHFADADELNNIKFRLIFSSLLPGGILNDVLKAGTTEFKYITDCVHAYVTKPKLIEDIKKTVFVVIEEALSASVKFHFETTSYEKYLTWCLGADNIAQYKLKFPLGVVFHNLVQNCIKRRAFAVTSSMTDLLEWFFESPQEIKTFKVNFWIYYHFVSRDGTNYNERIERMLRDPKCRSQAFQWFHDGDIELVDVM